MLDIKYIKEHQALVRQAIRDKGIELDLAELLQVREHFEKLDQQVDLLRQKRNKLSKAKDNEGQGDEGLRRELARELNAEIKAKEAELRDLQIHYDQLMLLVPNPVLADVPVGKDDSDNVELYKCSELRQFDFKPKDHYELACDLGLVDFERARLVGGSRAYALKGQGILLEMAVLRLALDYLITRGFGLYAPPIMVRPEIMEGTGYFPLGRENAYGLAKDAEYLTGTAEVGLVGMQADTVFDLEQLPLKIAGISPCFRREAGAAGRDTRGLYRVHQFQKVEQVVIAPADLDIAKDLHYEILGNAEAILTMLGLPYRVVAVCTGDIGQGQIFKHDIETYMPGRAGYGETHSCSLMGDFQARRLRIRYKDRDGKKHLAYTLNNTAAATPRLLIPILEHYQNADGTVTIPEVLRPYMGGKTLLGFAWAARL
ncbi:MAG: serine--tRNA ligase [Candidatus Obscuribacter sp.]|nr:serine--tRNA ligase [Candidatus Obscuribacter sp.]